MKKIVIAASLVAAVALGAFARDKFFAPSATAYYLDASSNCIPLIAQSGAQPFDAQGGSTAATITNATTGTTQLFINSICTQAAKFNP